MKASIEKWTEKYPDAKECKAKTRGVATLPQIKAVVNLMCGPKSSILQCAITQSGFTVVASADAYAAGDKGLFSDEEAVRS